MSEQAIEAVAKEFRCDCEVCSHTAAMCPASASSLLMEVANLRQQLALTQADSRRLDTLLRIGNNEGHHGWAVMLRYDNYQDGAQILDCDGKIMADCYDLDKTPEEQYRAALDQAAAGEKSGSES